MRIRVTLASLLGSAFLSTVAAAAPFIFSTDGPDGRMGMASRPGLGGKPEIEAADDFVLGAQTQINIATFTGLILNGATIGAVDVEIYRVFPGDSTNPPSGKVPTRVNSPSSDVAFDSRGTLASNLTFSTMVLNNNFTVANVVQNGINPIPNQTTGGEGPTLGQEVQFTVNFTTPLILGADHYFFVPQVQVTGGEFYWLSSAKPIVAPGTPFAPDLQAWIRNSNLDPDWLRVGTDIVGGTTPPTFNGTFSLNGETPPPGNGGGGSVPLPVAAVAGFDHPAGCHGHREIPPSGTRASLILTAAPSSTSGLNLSFARVDAMMGPAPSSSHRQPRSRTWPEASSAGPPARRRSRIARVPFTRWLIGWPAYGGYASAHLPLIRVCFNGDSDGQTKIQVQVCNGAGGRAGD